jgi:hypothetical protein
VKRDYNQHQKVKPSALQPNITTSPATACAIATMTDLDRHLNILWAFIRHREELRLLVGGVLILILPEFGEEDLATCVVEVTKRAVGRLDDSEEGMLVMVEEALRTPNVNLAKGRLAIRIEHTDVDLIKRAAASQESEQLEHTPQTRRVRLAGEDDELLGEEEKDRQRTKTCVDVASLVNACLGT